MAQVRSYLERRGWRTVKANPALKFIGPGRVRSVEEDFFGAFDIIAMKRGEAVMMIQCTAGTGSAVSSRLEKVRAASSWLPLVVECQLWWRGARGTARIRECVDGIVKAENAPVRLSL